MNAKRKDRIGGSTLHAACVLTTLLAAACTRGSATSAPDPSASAAPHPLAPLATASASAAADPSCALVTKQEAEAILGEPLQELAVTASGMCEYRREADRGKKIAMPLAGLKLYPGESKAVFEAETKNAASMMKEHLKPIAGFGEEAFEVGTFQIMALEHGKAISATHLLPLDAAKFQAFAHKALSKL